MNGITEGWSDYSMWTGVVLGRLGSISTESWPTIWMILEVNLISFLPLITQKWNVKKIRIIYFIVQRVGSLTILSGGVMSDRTVYFRKWVSLGLLLKARLAPIHFWGAPVIVTLNKLLSFIFLTWQKIAPVMLLIRVTAKILICSVLLMNRLVASFGGVGRKNLILLIFYSGLMHLSWVIAAPMSGSYSYFLIYLITSAPIFFNTTDLPLLIMNLAGFPPMTGFFMKLMVLQGLRSNIGVLLLALSLFIIFSYIRMFLYPVVKSSGKVKLSTILVCTLGVLCWTTSPVSHSSFKWEAITRCIK